MFILGQVAAGCLTDDNGKIPRLIKIWQALRSHKWRLINMLEKENVQSLHSSGTNIWGRNLEVNKESQ